MRNLLTIDFTNQNQNTLHISGDGNEVIMFFKPLASQTSGFSVIQTGTTAVSSADLTEVDDGWLMFQMPAEWYANAGTNQIMLGSDQGNSDTVTITVNTDISTLENVWCSMSGHDFVLKVKERDAQNLYVDGFAHIGEANERHMVIGSADTYAFLHSRDSAEQYHNNLVMYDDYIRTKGDIRIKTKYPLFATSGSATLNSSNVTDGSIKYFTIGNVCFLQLFDLKFTATAHNNNASAKVAADLIASNLPEALTGDTIAMYPYGSDRQILRAQVNTEGQIYFHRSGTPNASYQYYGFYAYITK